MATAICRGIISRVTNDTTMCEKRGKDSCPLMKKQYKKLAEDPCCYALLIPARFISQNNTSQLAARKYVEECLLAETPHLDTRPLCG